MLGKTATVTVDRPLGSPGTGPRGAVCPLNCGYIEGPDGTRQSAYVFGVNRSVSSFTGEVLAVLTRQKDRTKAYIVAPTGTVAYEPELRRAVAFAERPYRSRMRCRYEKSCGAVLFTEKGGVRLYLLIRNRGGNYGFPKGHVEGRENEIETARREIREETGLRSVKLVDGFRQTNRYVVRSVTHKEVVLFLARFDSRQPIHPTHEITEYRLLPFEAAVQAVHFERDKQILHLTEQFLSEQAAR